MKRIGEKKTRFVVNLKKRIGRETQALCLKRPLPQTIVEVAFKVIEERLDMPLQRVPCEALNVVK